MNKNKDYIDAAKNILKASWRADYATAFKAIFKLQFLFIKDLFEFMALPFSTKERGSEFMSRWKLGLFLKRSNEGLLIDGISRRLSINDSYYHLAVVGPSGHGKTTQYIIPNVFTLMNSSLVITDPSGEIYRKTSGHLKDNGFTLRVLNPSTPRYSVKYNPLRRVKSYQDASEVAHILIKSANPEYGKGKDSFWNKGAEDIISIFVQTLQNMAKKNPANRKYLNLHNVLALIQLWGAEGSAMDKFLSINAPESAYRQYKGFFMGHEKIIQSHISVAMSSLRDLNDPNIARMMARDELNFKSLRRKKTAIFLAIPSTKLTDHSFFLSLFYTQLFRTLMEGPENPPGLPIYCLMDEAGHYPIPQFEVTSPTIRKYKVSLSLIFQALAQLETLYGKDGAQTVFEGGTSSKLFYAGLDLQTAKMVSEKLGASLDPDTGKKTKLMEPDVVSRMKDEEALYFFYNKQPVLLKTQKYYENNYFSWCANKAAIPIPKRPAEDIHYIKID